MNFPSELKYQKTHEWVRDLGGGRYEIGLTDYAQSALGDLVFVGLPEVGDAIKSGDSFADVESVKAVSDIETQLTGTVCEVNKELEDAPEKINEAPYEAWLARVENVTEIGELLDAEAYAALVAEEEA